MKTVNELVHKLMVMLDDEIEKRNETFENRSERWQESEKGETYSELTELAENLRDECDTFLNSQCPW